MTSIITNIQAMAALDTLRSINSGMEETQARVSSGYKVKDASDNAAYWSIATTMRSDNKALATVQDAIAFGAAKTDTAYTGLNSAIDVVTEIKAKLVAAREPGVDKEKINSELTELKNQLTSIASSASFSGQNWLYRTANDTTLGEVEMVGSFTRSGTGNVSVGTIKFDTTNSLLIDTQTSANGALTKASTVQTPDPTTGVYGPSTNAYYLIKSDDNTSDTEIKLDNTMNDPTVIDQMVQRIDDMLTQMTESAATLGATNQRLDMQNEFVADLMDVIDKGVGRLVDADMNEESTKLKALQTQQQLGIQALSIANSNSENILSLFRN